MNSIDYEKLVRNLVLNANISISDVVVLETTEKSISIEFKNRNLIIKEYDPKGIDDTNWRRFFVQIFTTLIQK